MRRMVRAIASSTGMRTPRTACTYDSSSDSDGSLANAAWSSIANGMSAASMRHSIARSCAHERPSTTMSAGGVPRSSSPRSRSTSGSSAAGESPLSVTTTRLDSCSGSAARMCLGTRPSPGSIARAAASTSPGPKRKVVDSE